MSFKPPSHVTVVKVGGSLFDLPDLASRLDRLLKSLPEQVVIVPGGGGFANEVRRLDQIHRWPAATSHQLALQSMSLTARVLAGASKNFALAAALADMETAWEGGFIPILDVVELPGIDTLPQSWNLTSDSIAAWASVGIAGGRLLLAKSSDLPQPLPSPSVAADLGLVDRCFPDFAADLQRIDWVNLRAEHPRPVVWSTRERSPTTVSDGTFE